jgi:hypothetical protein
MTQGRMTEAVAPRSRAVVVLARALSTLGHPVVLTPIAAMLAAASRGASQEHVRSIGLTLGGLAVLVMAYSWWQVVSGRWSHVDASKPRERHTLILFLAVVLFLSAAVAWAMDQRELGTAVGLAAILVTSHRLSPPRFKMSLHVAFAAFSTALVWPNATWMIVGALVTAAIAWSRFVLARHVAAEIVQGLVLGAAAGALFHPLTR